MSKSLESQVWKSNLSGDLKPILALMADIANDEGYGVFFSVDKLAWLLGVSGRSVQYKLKQLKEMGVLEVEIAGGGRRTTRHRVIADLLPQRAEWQAKREVKPTSPLTEPKRNPLHPRGETGFTAGVKPTSPDPLVDPLVDPKEPPTSPKGDFAEDVVKVFEYWKKKTEKTDRVILSNDRRRKVIARLKEGYTVKDLKMAIVGCLNSPFHQGENGTNTVYDDLETICRSASKVDMFIAKANQDLSPSKSETSSSYRAYAPPGEPAFRPSVEDFMRAARIPTLEEAQAMYNETAWADPDFGK